MVSRFIYSNSGFNFNFVYWQVSARVFKRTLFAWINSVGGAQDPISDNNKITTFINFCKQHSIDTIYLDMYVYLGSSNWSAANVTAMQTFIQAASAAGISVWALAGNTDWSTPAVQGWITTNIINHINDYNTASTASQKFSGFMLDVEYWLDSAQTATNGLSGLCDLVSTMKASNQIPIGAFAPFYFMDNSRPNVLYNGATKQEGAHLMDTCDVVVVGAYRSLATDQISLMQPWLQYSGNAQIYCGAETGDVGDSTVSYFGESFSSFETQQALVNTAFTSNIKFLGAAVHSYDTFKVLT